MKNPLDACIRKFVAVEAAGIRYFGTLIEVGEEEAVLKTPTRWVTVPIDRISSVREVEPRALEDADFESVDADEFAPAGAQGDEEA